MMQQPSEKLVAVQKAVQELLNEEYPDQVLVDFALVSFSVSTDMDTLEDKPKYKVYSSTGYPHTVVGLLAYGVDFFEGTPFNTDEDED